MKNLSLVTVKVVRENENYKYRLVGKGEKYLVRHDAENNAGDIVVKELTPFAKETIVVEQVLLQKNAEIIESCGEFIYKAAIKYIEIDDTGKERKITRRYYVQSDSARDAFDAVAEFLSGSLNDACIMSVTQTNIIELLLL